MPETKYLKDYKKPDFKIGGIHLDFDLHDGKTTVKAVTSFTRGNAAAKDLVLDGHGFVLKSILLDGKTPDYVTGEESLTVRNVPDTFTLEVITALEPEKNTALEGLYRSSGNFCTQCEPEGFRQITYYIDRPDALAVFTVRIEADKASCPVLLSNGNPKEKGDLGGGRHFAVWHDPHPKPCYLFALVAGNLTHLHDTFTTMSGKKTDLYIHVNPGNEDKCAHAMDSLKRSMKWDEEKYGREYDLDVFNIVAVNDFNFGGMENKGLNIFNSKLILARPETATDANYLDIESVVAHEYFHNWTGDRITCRDWFQLSLKEGLTVFRDQQFSGDMNSHTVQRIGDVAVLRADQFAEDAGPTAHPVRPADYIEINNFYTRTVYEKGAEVIRMMHTILGPEKYRKATDLYFTRHDGQAVTCDDFAQCMQDASGIDLSQFRLWYSQAGTPEVTAKSAYDAAEKTFTLTLSQRIPDTPGQTGKKPMHIPFAVGLVGPDGRDLAHEVLQLKEKEQAFTFANINTKPVPSLLRGFSAPVRLVSDLTDDDLLFLMAHDADGFNKWDAGQTYLQRLILNLASGAAKEIPAALADAFGALLNDRKNDKGLTATALALPAEVYLAQFMDPVDVDGLNAARKRIMAGIGKAHQKDFLRIYEDNTLDGPYDVTPASVGARRLKGAALRYIQAADAAQAADLAAAQFKSARNMTDKIAALAVLADGDTPARAEAFAAFHAAWKHDPLVLDKWFALQAGADRASTVADVRTLTAHPDFTYKNPNRLRSLVGVFGTNQKWFHSADGAGYKLLADTVITVDPLNPQAAAGLLKPLRPWKRYDAARRAMMEGELKRILGRNDLSNAVYEIVSKSLNG